MAARKRGAERYTLGVFVTQRHRQIPTQIKKGEEDKTREETETDAPQDNAKTKRRNATMRAR
jgi:hypothetical protein